MSELPADLKYANSHEWVKVNDDGSLTVGISDHAQELLGDVVFVECPEVGATVTAEQACAVVESVKAASDIYAPVSGEVIACNDELTDSPDLINQDAYGEGWMFKLRPDDGTAVENLLDAESYRKRIEEED